MNSICRASVGFWIALVSSSSWAQPFRLPTANQALFESSGEEKFFAGTVGKLWTSGQFGCVRSDGRQMHEGLDIRCLQRDARGEPTDPVMATADGTVVYFNTKSSLSNYGTYLILRHEIDGLEIYSLYAHLKKIREGLKVGEPINLGEVIATMGRTTNTRQGISKDRAHVHFELNFLVNDRFSLWYKKAFPDQRNDHGEWNGQNFLGIDPRIVLLAQKKQGAGFRLLALIQSQPELCRVLVRDTGFPWLQRYPALVQPRAATETEGVAGYEIALDYNGVPLRLIPRTASEIKSKARFQLLSVNETEYQKHPCRHLVVKRNGRWELAQNGNNLLGLLTY